MQHIQTPQPVGSDEFVQMDSVIACVEFLGQWELCQRFSKYFTFQFLNILLAKIKKDVNNYRLDVIKGW